MHEFLASDPVRMHIWPDSYPSGVSLGHITREVVVMGGQSLEKQMKAVSAFMPPPTVQKCGSACGDAAAVWSSAPRA